MQYLRYVLLALSAAGVLAVVGALKAYTSDLTLSAAFFVMALGAGFLANFVYVLQHSPANSERADIGRPFRLFRLWLDAKESELKRRSTQAN